MKRTLVDISYRTVKGWFTTQCSIAYWETVGKHNLSADVREWIAIVRVV